VYTAEAVSARDYKYLHYRRPDSLRTLAAVCGVVLANGLANTLGLLS